MGSEPPPVPVRWTPSDEELRLEPAGLADVPAAVAADVNNALSLTAFETGAEAVDVFFRVPDKTLRWFAGSRPTPSIAMADAERAFEMTGDGAFEAQGDGRGGRIFVRRLDGVRGDFRVLIDDRSGAMPAGKLQQAVITAKLCVRMVRGSRYMAHVEARADSLARVSQMLSTVLQSASVQDVLSFLTKEIAQFTRSQSVAIDSYDFVADSMARDVYTDDSWPNSESDMDRWRELLEVRIRDMKAGKLNDAGDLNAWRSPWVLPDVQHPFVLAACSPEEREFFRQIGIRTSVLIPLWVAVQFVGVLSANNNYVRNYTRAELDILSRMADVAAVAIRALQLMKELRASKKSEQESYLANIARLAAAAKARDDTTARHLENLQHSVRLIAEELLDDGHQVEEIALASSMHDIGKISVPDSILLKPGKLTFQEREIMSRHTLHGEALLGGAFLDTARRVARWHHERWDGSGYPDGLSGEDIPLAARIVSVADVYDALISVRPYKNAWAPTKAIREIKRGSASQFDARVTDVFVGLWKQGKVSARSAA